VIIDEASQSGPEALLLNYIADKLIVVGDDKQITPMHVGVDRSAVEFLRRKHLKDIPHPEALDLEGSLFSQAELRFPDRIRLREHFRCMPEIIQFSNNLSYTTEPLIPLRQYGADRLEPLRTVFVKDGYRKGSSDDIENPPEAEAIVAQIAECCENPLYAGKTFGIICLKGGNRQADLINGMLVKEIGAEEIERRNIVCGRPYDFQGDERDVIFLGLVDALSDGIIRCDISNPDVQRRYNVAASRARDQLWLFHSMELESLRKGSYQYRLLEYCQNPSVQSDNLPFDTAELGKQRRDMRPPEPFESWFEVDVFLQIHAREFRVLPQYEVATYRIDLVVEGIKGRLAVECDGDEWHGPDRYESDMARQRDLERCGWMFWRVRGSDFYRDPVAALAELWETLERLKISPRHAWESDRREAESTVGERCTESAASKEHLVHHEDDEEDDDQDREESPAEETTDGRLDRALEYVRSQSRRSQDLPPLDIQNAILQVLQKCPNHTCTLKSLTSRVLKELGVLTRGNPRLEFEKRVMRNLGALKRKELVEEYKAKNRRIRLLLSPRGSLLFQ
jgi:very-short-patch-repair endonuclease